MSGWMGCLCKILILQPGTDAQPLTPMDKLKETHKRQKKKSQTYKKKASQEARKEKEFRRAGDERAASRCSEMKTLYYKQIEQLENSQLQIRKKIILLEGEKARTETVDALESGEEELKKMQEVKNTDDGDRTVDEMNRGMVNVNESEDSSSIFSDAATHFDGD
ncbi:vacuolar protein sorting-associated protein 32 homolog 2 isoform X1 [Eucalyptus grandis]|uniref:vacuolar protein sorting-associated protein 32 homolog 2 isoform X1 n=1 Tax=Eucalyptus grandis TaxID=71139 RepID=UPI00192E9BA6|nr:vacuolar protein sorting-associated protein 32 homolog 2 isoform X1 [Eucalyptus grandis]